MQHLSNPDGSQVYCPKVDDSTLVVKGRCEACNAKVGR